MPFLSLSLPSGGWLPCCSNAACWHCSFWCSLQAPPPDAEHPGLGENRNGRHAFVCTRGCGRGAGMTCQPSNLTHLCHTPLLNLFADNQLIFNVGVTAKLMYECAGQCCVVDWPVLAGPSQRIPATQMTCWTRCDSEGPPLGEARDLLPEPGPQLPEPGPQLPAGPPQADHPVAVCPSADGSADILSTEL